MSKVKPYFYQIPSLFLLNDLKNENVYKTLLFYLLLLLVDPSPSDVIFPYRPLSLQKP